jgi:hypothetical protein
VAVVATHLLVFMLLSKIRPNLSEAADSNVQNPEPLQWLDLTQAPV